MPSFEIDVADSRGTEDDEEHGSCTVQAEADAATLSKEIAGLDEDISVWEGDKKASTEVGCAFLAGWQQDSVDASSRISSGTAMPYRRTGANSRRLA